MYSQIVKNIFRNISLDYPGLLNKEGSSFDVKLTINGSNLQTDINIEDGEYLITNAKETDITSSGTINDYHKFENNNSSNDVFVFSRNEIIQDVKLHKLEYIFSNNRQEAYSVLQNSEDPTFIIYLISTESNESNFDENRSINDYKIINRFGVIFRGSYILYVNNIITNLDLVTKYDDHFIKSVLFSINTVDNIEQVNFDNIESRGLTSKGSYYTDYVFSIKRTLSFDQDYIKNRQKATVKNFIYNIKTKEGINA